MSLTVSRKQLERFLDKVVHVEDPDGTHYLGTMHTENGQFYLQPSTAFVTDRDVTGRVAPYIVTSDALVSIPDRRNTYRWHRIKLDR